MGIGLTPLWKSLSTLAEVTSAERQQFLRQGYLIVPNVVAEAELDAVRGA